ncbi:hypothetical protein G7Z17_g693 [Cylindrodendrum hubeiense]|uniref:Beta-xylosidase C-terminal Concanavalin A-like domain-containing protein n=1 Tax=Cylindrodendrum hubeiense TaxID=595255 RepID=A0A9P5HMX0_9HYPO|nr:hypothetical protein G7Z17_g693 [Cylindrodendrum hubeiense]
MTSINPIIPGFAPDPSCIKVGDWYFLVNSTFHFFPGLPIYASQDLVSWTQIGNAINRPGALSLAKSRTKPVTQDNGCVLLAAGGLYAPTIRFHDGTFFVDVWSNNWSDPVYFKFDGIDPSIFFDDDGKVYIHGANNVGGSSAVTNFEVDINTGELLSPERVLWSGTGGLYPEGPHIYKKDGWYYLMISEGGTLEGHMVTIARSKGIWGPYEECPHNPILSARGTDEYIQHTGHCDAFQDGDGNWVGVCLGVRKDGEGRFVMGRETFLTRGNWDEDWPSFDPVKLDPTGLEPKQGYVSPTAAPNVEFLYIRDYDMTRYSILEGGALITLTPSATDLSHPEMSPTFIGRRQRLLKGESSATVKEGQDSWAGKHVKTGLACYKDEFRYARIYYDASISAVVFELNHFLQEKMKTQTHPVKIASTLSLKIEYTEQDYHLSFRSEQSSSGSWKTLGVVDTLDLTGSDYVGPVIGVFAVAEGPEARVDVLDFTVN